MTLDGNVYLGEMIIMNKQAMIFGYILGDGWIDCHGFCGASGDANSLEILANDIDSFCKEKVSGKIYTRKTTSPKYGISGTTSQFYIGIKMSKALQSLGMPTGKRAGTEYCLPDWIINGDNDVKTSFLSGFYAAEGYIPTMQKNKKTPRTLNFSFAKNIELIDSSRKLANQYKDLITSLGLEVTVKEIFVTTNSQKIKQTFDIGNSEESFLKALKLFDFRYCIQKEVRRTQMIRYFELKQYEREKILRIHGKIINEYANNGTTMSQLASKYNLSKFQIQKIIYGRSHAKQVRGFPKFDQKFIDTYCLSKTPLKDENLSDFMRQITTCQALIDLK